MANETIQKDGRRWTVDGRGVSSLKRKYIIAIDGTNLGPNAESASLTNIPAIGSAHPTMPGLKVQSYDVEEGEQGEKRILSVTVNYAVVSTEAGSEQGSELCAVDEWGWDTATEDKELTTAQDGTAVLNSAGDPFDAVPSVSTAAPVFTKVMRFTTRQSGVVLGYSCKVNASAVTIGGESFPANSLLCTVSERRVFGDAHYKYQYTVQLKYKSNLVKLAGASTLTDIGWDVAITDAGMREKDATTGKLKLIKQLDAESGKRLAITSPELLNGSGQPVTRDSSSTPTPYNLRFAAYPTATFPDWFYSEPT